MRGAFALATVMMLGGAACAGQSTQARPTTAQEVVAGATAATRDPDVVDFQGVRDVRFGASRSELGSRLNVSHTGCSTQVTGIPQANLVFAPDDRLVMMWFYAPLHTPEGIGTGSSLQDARAAYPGAQALTAPARTERFDGLLVTRGDRGYLFLHDGVTVQKALAGYSDYLNRLFDTGFGSC